MRLKYRFKMTIAVSIRHSEVRILFRGNQRIRAIVSTVPETALGNNNHQKMKKKRINHLLNLRGEIIVKDNPRVSSVISSSHYIIKSFHLKNLWKNKRKKMMTLKLARKARKARKRIRRKIILLLNFPRNYFVLNKRKMCY